MRGKFTLIACLGLSLSLFATRSQANVQFLLGNHPQTDENVLAMGSTQTGSTVYGVTNDTQTIIRFDSTTDTLHEPSNGQAKFTDLNTDVLVNDIKISVPNSSFLTLISNPFDGYEGADRHHPLTNTLYIVVKTVDAQTFNFSETLGNGQNFFTLIADGGTQIASVELSSSLGFQDLRQVRIGGFPVAVPLPAAGLSGLLMLGGMGAVRARKMLSL